MLKNYFKTAIRSILKHRFYSIINIFGLSLGLACCILIVLYVHNELSFDQFHQQKERIFRVSMEYGSGGNVNKTTVSPTAVLPVFSREFPEVETGVRIYNPASFRPYAVRKDEKVFQENKFFYADNTFFKVFSFNLLSGDVEKALAEPNSVILTQSSAQKYFGPDWQSKNLIGESITINAKSEFQITGIMEDIPANSHFHADFVASFNTLPQSKEEIWWAANYSTYLVLTSQEAVYSLRDKIPALMQRELGSELSAGTTVNYNFMPITDIHLRSRLEHELEPGGDIKYVYIFSIIAILILIIACINYMNLATARAADRAKEVGMRKVLGAYKGQLFSQFIGEAILTTFIATLFSQLFVFSLLPYFNNLTKRQLSLNYMENPEILIGLIVVWIVVSFLAGSYPAFALSSFKPIKVLKGKFISSTSGTILRKSLVVFQFAISMFLILGTIVVYKQLGFIQDKKLGYDKEQLISIPLDSIIEKNLEAIKTEFTNHQTVISLTSASETIIDIKGGYSLWGEGKSDDFKLDVTAIAMDKDFVKTTGLEIIEGEDLTLADMQASGREDRELREFAFILNESAVKNLGWKVEKAIGKKLNLNGRKGYLKAIVKDFHFSSLHNAIGSLVMFNQASQVSTIMAKIAADDINGALAYLKNKWQILVPHRPFEYEFLDQEFKALYSAEERIGEVFGVFAIVAILIACLGLFGLASFTTAQRTKEISIRKVLGASVGSVVTLLSTDFTKLVGIAFVFAIPMGYFLMDQWLNEFSYKISVGVDSAIIAGIVALFIALLTISYQAIKAALSNPVNSLRNE